MDENDPDWMPIGGSGKWTIAAFVAKTLCSWIVRRVAMPLIAPSEPPPTLACKQQESPGAMQQHGAINFSAGNVTNITYNNTTNNFYLLPAQQDLPHASGNNKPKKIAPPKKDGAKADERRKPK